MALRVKVNINKWIKRTDAPAASLFVPLAKWRHNNFAGVCMSVCIYTYSP